MIRAVADTHSLLWYVRRDPRLSPTALETIERIARDGDEVGISAITLVELVYLEEKDRLPEGTGRAVAALLDRGPALFVEVPLSRAVVQAMLQVPRGEVPDLPDRVIAATAVQLGVPVISRDAAIRSSPAVEVVW